MSAKLPQLDVESVKSFVETTDDIDQAITSLQNKDFLILFHLRNFYSKFSLFLLMIFLLYITNQFQC